MAVANRDLIRSINQFSILNAIRTTGTISRVEIAEVTGQSKASVTNITARLIEKGLIYEKETVDSKCVPLLGTSSVSPRFFQDTASVKQWHTTSSTGYQHDRNTQRGA